MMLRPFMRRLLEISFDGKPEAVGDVDARAASYRASLQKDRERLAIPPDSAESTKLAAHYHSAELGDLMIRTLEKASFSMSANGKARWRHAGMTTEAFRSSRSIRPSRGSNSSSRSAAANAL
jgi:hypothetical protein